MTSRQLRNLPQNDRNFLNFALAPGVGVNAGSETTKEVTAGALPGFNTNVYIDGVRFKNDVLLGGVVGQDSTPCKPWSGPPHASTVAGRGATIRHGRSTEVPTYISFRCISS